MDALLLEEAPQKEKDFNQKILHQRPTRTILPESFRKTHAPDIAIYCRARHNGVRTVSSWLLLVAVSICYSFSCERKARYNGENAIPAQTMLCDEYFCWKWSEQVLVGIVRGFGTDLGVLPTFDAL